MQRATIVRHTNLKSVSLTSSLVTSTQRLPVRCGVNHEERSGSIHGSRTRSKGIMYTASRHFSGHVVSSQYPDVDVDSIKQTPLPHYVINEFKRYHKQTAMVDSSTGWSVTYAELETMIARVGSWFVRHQLVTKGSVVTIYSTNCIEFTVVYLAVTSAGGVVSAVNPTYTVNELKNAINDVQSTVLITSNSLKPIAKQARLQCHSIKKLIVFGEGDADCQSFSSLLSDDMSLFPTNIDFNTKQDLVALPFSSGTTGLPKGVMLTHYCVTANIIQSKSSNVMNLEPGMESIPCVLPFYHIYGQSTIMLTGLVSGAKIVVISKFEPKSFLEIVQQHKATFLPVVPPIMLFMSKSPLVGDFDFSSVRAIMTGAAPIGEKIIELAKERCRSSKLIVQQGYGMTESSPLTHMHSPKDIKAHTVGNAIPNTQFKVVDIETGEALGPGKNGELCVRGPQVMRGYHNNEKATNETIKDGWLHTGDLGRYDEDEHLIIDDRIKELIKVKGLQVAPAELEALLMSHVVVQDAAVIGRPDERAGEIPTAFVVLKPSCRITEAELQHYVAEQVAPHKRLIGGVIFCSQIPKNASGKILRKELRIELQNKLHPSS